jgi:hypothetical protein
MPLKNACFISYRHYKGNELVEAMVEGLYKALKNELQIINSKINVYRDDRGGLEGGDKLEEKLPTDLCESACLVVAYLPEYFDKEHTWCAREFRAMMELEEKRQKLLDEVEKKHGLIIVAVFRGGDNIPESLKKGRLFYVFEDYLLSDPEIYKNPKYTPEIRKMAEYIGKRFNKLNEIIPDPCDECTDFKFPEEDAIKQWIDELNGIKSASGAEIKSSSTLAHQPAVPFPLRKASTDAA